MNACLCLTVTSECLQQCRKLSRLRAISTFAKARYETEIFRPSGRTRYCKKSSGEGQLSRGVSRFWIEPRASTSALPAASAEKACAILASYKATEWVDCTECGQRFEKQVTTINVLQIARGDETCNGLAMLPVEFLLACHN